MPLICTTFRAVIALAFVVASGCTSEAQPKKSVPSADTPPMPPAPQGVPREASPPRQALRAQPNERIYVVQEGETIYAATTDACNDLEPVTAALNAGADIQAIVRRDPNGRVAVAGRTNLPDETLVFGGVDGYGGWFDEHMRVRAGCFHGPWMDVPAGLYALGIAISGMTDEMPAGVVQLVGEDGEKLKGPLVRRVDGKRKLEYVRPVTVGDAAAARAAEQKYEELPRRVVADATRLITAGKNMERFRLRRGSVAFEDELAAGAECGRLMRELRPQAEQFATPFLPFRSVLHPGHLGALTQALSFCVSCSPEISMRECKKAAELLRQKSDLLQRDALQGYR